MINLKEIHIGWLIEKKWKEQDFSMKRTSNFFKCQEEEIKTMFQQKILDTDVLMKWSKLLEYDFFRLYSQHLILYSSSSSVNAKNKKQNKTSLPVFRKNLYTQEIIDFILELVKTGEKTKQQIITEYRIPKTTLYKWIAKYGELEEK